MEEPSLRIKKLSQVDALQTSNFMCAICLKNFILGEDVVSSIWGLIGHCGRAAERFENAG